MHSPKFTLDDLILDQSFIQWVKNPSIENGLVWIEWASKDIKNQNLIREAKEIILELAKDDDAPVNEELAGLWLRILDSNEAFDKQQRTISPKNKVFIFLKSWQRVAAVFVAVFILSAIAFIVLNRNMKYQTAFGENKTIVLPDGSKVMLNANSSVSYAPSWNNEQPREIWLAGEAFFSVTHKRNSQKFVVHTQDLDVQVLGTKFDVKARLLNTSVILNSGKVKLFLVNHHNKEIDMKPGDCVEFSEENRFVTRKIVKAKNFSAWVNKKLVFEETSLREIAQLLDDSYGYKVKFINPELMKLTFTGTVDSENIGLLLTILQKTFSISIKKQGENITISN
jgi:transmembrane sensor